MLILNRSNIDIFLAFPNLPLFSWTKSASTKRIYIPFAVYSSFSFRRITPVHVTLCTDLLRSCISVARLKGSLPKKWVIFTQPKPSPENSVELSAKEKYNMNFVGV
jgi:hypothetical protein